MERKLASIRKIKNIVDIQGADFISLASVDGWNSIVKKNEFEIGSLCIFIEIDAMLPIKPEFEFLRKSCYKKMPDGTEFFRIKTQKFKGVISQGLILPISILNEKVDESNIGEDVSLKLNIIKYEPPIPAQLLGKVKGNFPYFIRKTDEEMIQNMEWVLSEYSNVPFYVTEKLDGTSFTAYYKDGNFGICSRNLELYETPDNTYWKVARELQLEEKMKLYDKNIALQGELIGEGINKNRLNIKGHKIKFFNVFNIDSGQYYNLDEFLNILSQFKLECVPMIDVEEFKLFNTVNEMVEYSKGKSIINTEIEREGIVIRTIEENEHIKYGRISFKVKNPNYLLKYKE